MASTPKPLLPLSLVNRENLLKLFYDPIRMDVHKKAAVHLHVLRVDGGDFAVGQLYKELSNATLGYVLSRQKIKALKEGDLSKHVEIVNKVQSQFRKPDAKAGEGGELLLYSLLEGYLGAPKILSKMELKTSANHYVNGSDGVHLLHDNEGTYQLIFGESKMYGDLTGKPRTSVKRAIEAAFKSMSKVHEEKFDFDTWLVESELLKEALDDDQLEALASIILPSASGDDPISKTNSFGVFIGYEIDGTAIPFADLGTAEIEKTLRDEAEAHLREQLDVISNQIKDLGLGGYHFHIYGVPFLKKTVKGKAEGLEKIRMDMVTAIRGGRSDT